MVRTVDLDTFLSQFQSDDVIKFASSDSGVEYGRAERLLSNYAAEARYAASILRGIDLQGMRILEVGAGIGVLTGTSAPI